MPPEIEHSGMVEDSNHKPRTATPEREAFMATKGHIKEKAGNVQLLVFLTRPFIHV